MRISLALALAAICLSSARSQTLPERKTFVAPSPGEDILKPCEYRVVIPAPSRPIRAVWTIYDRGIDHLNWFHDPDVQKMAADHRVALILAMHCRSKDREDMDVLPDRGVGRALLTALDQFAESENRPELRTVPVIYQGWSGAGSLVGRMAGYRPDRYLAGIAYAPGQYEPLGMDTIRLSAEAIRVPQLIIANGSDTINGTERPYNYFRKYFDQGAPWTFAVQNRTPHCCLQNAKELILAWTRSILDSGPSCRETGYILPDPASLLDEWKNPVFNARSAHAGAGRHAGRPGELAAGCLPSRAYTREWLRFEKRFAPPAVWKP